MVQQNSLQAQSTFSQFKRSKKIFEKLTIVILSRERNSHLKATIEYYNKFGISLLVLHKSSRSIEFEAKNSKIKYIRVEESFADRCAIAKNHIKSPYAILSTDDERFLPSSLEKMIRILEKNKNINSIGGQAIAFFSYGKLLCAQRLYTYLLNYSNNKRQLSKRLEYHFETAGNNITFSSMYRMYRKKDFISMLGLFSLGKDVSTALITEVTSEIFSLYRGGIAYINDLYWVRNFMVEPIKNSDWSRDTTFIKWWRHNDYSTEKTKWLNEIGSILPTSKVFKILKFIEHNRLKEVYKKPFRVASLSVNFKYNIRRYFLPKTIPKSLGEILIELTFSKTNFDNLELLDAITSIHSPFNSINLEDKK